VINVSTVRGGGKVFKRTISKRVGQLLIERDLITPQQLDVALAQQRQQGGYISQHLISLKYATEFDIALCLSNQYNFAYLPLAHYSITQDILKLIPLKWVMLYTLIPVDRIGRVVTVAMADPLNEGVIRMLEEMTNCELQVLISTYSEIKEAINKYYRDDLQKIKNVPGPDLSKIAIAEKDIQTKEYNGIDRRKYLRVNIKQSLEFNFHSVLFLTETINLSFAGICFTSRAAIPVDTDLNCKLYLTLDLYIECIVKVLRVQGIRAPLQEASLYEIAGVFEFMGNEDRARLADLLREHVQ
jgi:hypothetical protein